MVDCVERVDGYLEVRWAGASANMAFSSKLDVAEEKPW